MQEEEINYKNLRKIQQMEKSSPMLTNLKANFYHDLKKYLDDLDNLVINEKSTQKKKILDEEIENTKKIAYNIYEQREKKILQATITKIRGGNPDLTNINEIEKELYDQVLNLIQKSREKFYEKKSEDNHISTETKTEVINKPIIIEEEKAENNNPIVLVNQDIHEFIGTDEKKYVLKKNDVLSLPKDMSDMLIKRGVVKSLNS